MKSLIKVKFPSGHKKYDYLAPGSPNELAGNTHAIVYGWEGWVLVEVCDIRPVEESTYEGKLKSVERLLKLEEGR